MSLALLTSSSTRLFRSCPRAYHHRYQDEIVGLRERRALAFGSLMHHALEAWWKTPDNRLIAAREAVTAHSPDGATEDTVKVGCLLELYDARWHDEGLDALHVEAEYRSPLINPLTGAPSRTFERAGKIDVIVRECSTNRTLLVEHKTSSEDISPGSDYWLKLTLDSQISHYYAGAKALGYDVDGCIYDVIGKPKHELLEATPLELRKYTKATKTETSRLYSSQRDVAETLDEFRDRLREVLAENPERYVRRAEVVRLTEDIRDAAFDDWQTAQLIRENTNANRWPRNPEACMRYGSRCAYWELCTRVGERDDPLIYRKERPHQELTQELQ